MGFGPFRQILKRLRQTAATLLLGAITNPHPVPHFSYSRIEISPKSPLLPCQLPKGFSQLEHLRSSSLRSVKQFLPRFRVRFLYIYFVSGFCLVFWIFSSMSLPKELYPSQDDLLYEEELLRNPFSLKLWWRYLIARSDAPFKKRFIIYERALKALPGSYKLWHAYLRERLEIVRNLPVTHPQYENLNNTFERALVTMHKMPRIWIMYLLTLTEQKLISKTRRTFDRALCALPVTQHDRIWEPYLVFVSQRGIPIETSLRVYRRYLKYDPSHIEDFIEFLVNSSLWQEAAERLASVLNDDQFYSIKGKTKHRLWLELCDLLTTHATEVSGLNVDAIIRGGIIR